MAFESLSERLETVFRKLRSRGALTEKDVRDGMREVRMALLEADVNFKVAKDFTQRVTEQAVGATVLESLTPGQMVVKLVHEELVQLMGGTKARLAEASHGPTVVLLCGLQGAGKTTHAAKLALYLKNQGQRPLLAACDVYRPAAVQQLQILGGKIQVPVLSIAGGTPVEIAEAALRQARDQGDTHVFLDTAGRLHIDDALMQELREIKAAVRPHEMLLVIDSMTGQDAVTAASAFDEHLGLDGLLLTKTDSDTRGGAALSVKAVTGKPIKFIGTGEKLGDLELFHPDRMAQRILGMGDVMTLIEKAETVLDEKKTAELEEKLRKNQFDFHDLLEQFRQMKQLGSMKEILGMIPGLGKQLRGTEIDERQFDRMAALILSMTPQERAKPDLINPNRKKRIAAGAGQKVEDVNRLLQQYKQMRDMLKKMGGKSGSKASKLQAARMMQQGFRGS